jgi:GntR family transcriptional repressor for pyruvate dehydrogenase complex
MQISHKTLGQEVMAQLLDLILKGHLKPGDQLPTQSQLTEQLQVGRSTVREALKGLAAMGLVEMKAGRGTFVKQMMPRTVISPELQALSMHRALTEHIWEAREILEPEIVALAVQRATEGDLSAIHDIMTEAEEAFKHGEPVDQLSPGFHLAIARASHSEVLVIFIESILSVLVHKEKLARRNPSYVQWELQSHRVIYKCIAERDALGARTRMVEHIDKSKAALLGMQTVHECEQPWSGE